MQTEQLGPYRIGARLGRGGMGSVYEAVDTTTGTTVAVKVLAAHLADDPGLKARFRAEIDTLKELRHPAIIQLLAFGEDDDQPYFAMELVRGKTVEQMIRAGRRFTWRETVSVALAVARGLKVAHDHGVIHRDLKPANLLVADGIPLGEGVKLADFGIAKLFGASGHTAQGNIVGTAEYMAPEQAAGQGIDHRADLYALGLVMYAMLAGRPPFRGSQLTEVIEKQRRTPAPRLSTTVSGVPPELDTLVDRLLSKDPAARPASALALTRLLTAIDTLVPEEDSGDDKLVISDLPGTVGPLAQKQPAGGDHTTLAGLDSHPPPAPIRPPAADATPAASARVAGSNPSVGADAAPRVPVRPPTVPDRKPDENPVNDADYGETTAGQPAVTGDLKPFGKSATEGFDEDITRIPPELAAAETRVDSGVRKRHTTLADLDRADRDRRKRSETRQAWLQGALAITLVTAVLVGGWALSRPPSADTLYQRIKAVSDDDDRELRDADETIRRFLDLHPTDRRAAEVTGLQRTIALDRLERQARRKLRSERLVAPIERDYRAAMAREPESPSACLEALQAIVALHPHPDSDSTADATDVSLWIDLTRRQIARLTPLAQDEQQEDLRRIDDILATAESLRIQAESSADPLARDEALARRRTLLRGIVDTYSRRPHARAAIRALGDVLPDDDSPAGAAPRPEAPPTAPNASPAGAAADIPPPGAGSR